MPDLNSILFARHLDDDEGVTAIVHKHWMLGIKHFLWPVFSFLLAWLVLYVVPFLLVFYLVALWAVGSLVWLLRNFFDYYLDAWIITDKGIIDVAWHGWFHRQSTRVLYSDIQGVSYEIQGVFAPNAMRVIRYRVRISPSMKHGQNISNTVTVTSPDVAGSVSDTEVVNVIEFLPQTGIGGFFNSLSAENQDYVIRPRARNASSSPIALPMIIWYNIIAIGLGGGALAGRRLFL